IMRADQFDHFLFGFTLRDILWVRVPLIARVLFGELRTTGLLLAVVGSAVLARGRRKEGIVLGGTFAIITLFAIDYSVYDVEVFLILPMIVLGITAAVGIEAVVSAIESQVTVSGVSLATAAVVMLVVVRGQFHANRVAN